MTDQTSRSSGAGRAGPDAAPMPTNGDGIRALPPSVEEALDREYLACTDESFAKLKDAFAAALASAREDHARVRDECFAWIAAHQEQMARAEAAESRALAAEEALREVLDADDDLWSKPVGYDARSTKAARRLYAAKSRARSVLSRGTEGER